MEHYLINVGTYLINTNRFLWTIYIYFHYKRNSYNTDKKQAIQAKLHRMLFSSVETEQACSLVSARIGQAQVGRGKNTSCAFISFAPCPGFLLYFWLFHCWLYFLLLFKFTHFHRFWPPYSQRPHIHSVSAIVSMQVSPKSSDWNLSSGCMSNWSCYKPGSWTSPLKFDFIIESSQPY